MIDYTIDMLQQLMPVGTGLFAFIDMVAIASNAKDSKEVRNRENRKILYATAIALLTFTLVLTVISPIGYLIEGRV